MSKFNNYLDNSSELDKTSRFNIINKEPVDKVEQRIFRQEIRIYILYIIFAIFIFFVIKELVYDLVLVKKAGINYYTLYENIKTY